jgi:hypothetical protein
MSALRNTPYDKTKNEVSLNYTLDNETNLYLDISSSNNTNERIQTRTEFNLDDSIIYHDMSRYKMSVLRFNLLHELFPIFTYYPNKTYQVAVRHTITGEFLVDDIKTTKDHPYTDDRINNLYSIEQLMKNINDTINELITDLKTKEPTVVVPNFNLQLYYDEENKINYIVGEDLLTTVADRIEIILSHDLAFHLQHLKYTEPFINTTILPDEGIIFKPRENINKDQRVEEDEGLIPNINGEVLNMVSSYNNTKFLSPVQKILLTGKLNNRSEITINNNNKVSFKDYITDFIPDINHIQQLNENIYYINEQETRYIDLTASSELNSLIINFEYEDILGNTKPIYLSPKQYLNIKLKFLKV